MNRKFRPWFTLAFEVGVLVFFVCAQCDRAFGAQATSESAQGFSIDRSSFNIRSSFCDNSIFSMIDRRIGWARGTNAIFKTTDGGDSWRRVLSDEPRQPMASFFCDAKRAWVVSGVTDDATNATVFRTADGGRSWTSVEVHLREPIMSCFVSFSDAKNGWLMLIPDHGMNSSPGNLYRSEDGGWSWREVNYANTIYDWDSYPKAAFESTVTNLTCGGPVSFRNARCGWLTGSLASTTPGYLFVTQDGGANWRGQTLSLPSSLENGRIEPELPRFFRRNGKEGIMAADFVPEDHRSTNFGTVIYGTADGGLIWHPTTPLKSSSRTCCFITVKEGWIWSDGSASDTRTLYHTTNGGVSWAPIKGTESLADLLHHREWIAQLDFVDKQNGWAVAIDDSLQTRLFRTTDGGQRWRAIRPAVQQ